MLYRRTDIKGGTYFFTVNLANRKSRVPVENIELLRSAFHKGKYQHPFVIDAMVILPDHLHAIWTLPEDDQDYPGRWMLIKSAFSRQLPKKEYINQSRLAKGERGIWQRRYWEHFIRDKDDLETHINYIHYNPVKHGYAKQPLDWPYSSLQKFISKGLVEPDWGKSLGQYKNLEFGENS